jgi:hypothetical protein
VSLILALLTSRDGIVASDGRRFGNAVFDNGTLVTPAPIESDDFDKTFSLDGGEVVGAFAGLMRFSGKDISEHVDESLQPLLAEKKDLLAIAKELSDGIKAKLTNIDPQEVVFDCRKLDVLILSGKWAPKGRLELAKLRFSPHNGAIISGSEVVRPEGQPWHSLFGDDHATATAHRFLSSNRARNKDAFFLRTLALRAMNVGINACGAQPYGPEPACGGKLFARRIRRKS